MSNLFTWQEDEPVQPKRDQLRQLGWTTQRRPMRTGGPVVIWIDPEDGRARTETEALQWLDEQSKKPHSPTGEDGA